MTEEITIIGGGVSGRSLIEQIRARDKKLKINLIDKNSILLKKSDFITNPLGKITLDLKAWAQNNSVQFNAGFVERINFKKRKIYFKDAQPQDFKELVIATGLVSNKLEIKGGHQEGCYYFSDIDVLRIKDLLKISQEIIISANTLLGVKLALSLKALGKEVRLISQEDLSQLKDTRLNINWPVKLDEVIGEKIVKAIKVSPLKLFSSEVVLLDSGFRAANKFLEEESIEIKDHFFSNLEGIYFLGDVSRQDIDKERAFKSNYQQAVEQGSLLANFFLDKTAPAFTAEPINQEFNLASILELVKGVQAFQTIEAA